MTKPKKIKSKASLDCTINTGTYCGYCDSCEIESKNNKFVLFMSLILISFIYSLGFVCGTKFGDTIVIKDDGSICAEIR